ncbi:MAG: hypothetical protein M0009_11780 [Deltaproteobacteria bacterium]|nr:hypothetical protein [Deltaproteobacteria bacterium]
MESEQGFSPFVESIGIGTARLARLRWRPTVIAMVKNGKMC